MKKGIDETGDIHDAEDNDSSNGLVIQDGLIDEIISIMYRQ